MSTPRLDQLRIRHLRFVGLLASAGSLAATAEQLSMTPSAASMMLKEIEGLFGAKLFQRRGRGMALTEHGNALLPRCRTVLGEIGAMGTTVLTTGQPLLRIGAFPHTTATALPRIVKCLTTAQPAWHVQIFDQSADRLVDMLNEGDIDLMLGRIPSKYADSQNTRELSQRVLYQSTLALVARKKHALAARKGLSLRDLLAWPWVLPSVLSTTRVAVSEAYLRQGLAPPVPIVESPSFFYSLSLVAQTDLLTCCAHSAAIQNHHQTSILDVKSGLESAPVAMVWRKSSALACRAAETLAQISQP
jgi:DNA-binding transcriptional LysR family regulator